MNVILMCTKIIIGVDFKIKTTNIDGKVVKLQIWLVNTFLMNFSLWFFLHYECISINGKHQCTTDENYNYFLWHFSLLYFLFLYAPFTVSSPFGCLCHHFPCVKRDTAGQERFKTITTAYYRGAMVCLIIIIIYMVKWKRSLFNVSLWCCPTF